MLAHLISQIFVSADGIYQAHNGHALACWTRFVIQN